MKSEVFSFRALSCMAVAFSALVLLGGVFSSAYASPPTALNTAMFTTVGVAKSSTLSATGGTAPLAYSKVTTADSKHGFASINSDGSYAYLPNPNFSGTDSFTFIATGADNVPSNEATVTITVLPVANAGTLTTLRNTFRTGTLTASGTAPFTYTVNQPTNGAVVPNPTYPAFKYTPKDGYTGADSFTFSVKDASGLSSASATIAVAVSLTNSVPTVTDGTFRTRPGQAVSGKLSAADADTSDTLTYTIVTQPAKGTVTPVYPNTNPNFIYTPNSGIGETAAETDTFTFRANDGTADSATTAAVTVTISPNTANTAPIANNVTVSGTVGQQIRGMLNGTDAENDLLNYTIVTQPKCGDILLGEGGNANFIYLSRLDKTGCNSAVTSAAGGTDSFTYKVNEQTTSPILASATDGIVTVNITKVCDSTGTTAKIGTTTPAADAATKIITLPTPTATAPQSATFPDESTGAASRVWTVVDVTGNTVGTCTVTPFTYSFTTAGTYTVNLIAVNAAGCAAPQAASVTVVAAQSCSTPAVIMTSPVATGGVVTVPAPTATTPQTVTFSNNTGTGSQTWTMKNNSTGAAVTLTNSTNQTVSYTFAAGSDGAYTVTLSTTRPGCTTPSTATVTVNVGNLLKITNITVNPANASQLLITGIGFSATCSELWYNTINSTTGATKLSPITVNTAGTQITASILHSGTYYFFVKNICVMPNTWSDSFAYTSIPVYSTILTIDDASAIQGKTNAAVRVSLNNSATSAVSSMQFDILYNATAGIHANGSYVLSSRTTGFSASVTPYENGANSKATVLIYKLSGSIAPGTGAIVDVLFNIDTGAAVGTSTMSLNNCVLSDISANRITSDCTDTAIFKVEPACGSPGDINKDGAINVLDLQMLINCIMGRGACNCCDLNSDSSYNIFDLQLLINKILSPVRSHVGRDNGQNTLTLPTVRAYKSGAGSFGLGLSNESVVSGGQFVFTYDATMGLSITDVRLTSRTADFSKDMEIDTSDPKNMKVTVLLYSMGKTVTPGSGDILEFVYTTSADAAGNTPLTFVTNLLSDSGAQPLTVSPQNGSLAITAAGDVNSSGSTPDLTDAILVLRILAGISVTEIINPNADVNGDNKISLEEVIYILQKVAGLR